jgi:hypothetical protein
MTTVTGFSATCPICKKGAAQETDARTLDRVLILPDPHELRTTTYFGVVKVFKCGSCRHKWEEVLESTTPTRLYESLWRKQHA